MADHSILEEKDQVRDLQQLNKIKQRYQQQQLQHQQQLQMLQQQQIQQHESITNSVSSRFKFPALLNSKSSENFNHLRRVAMSTVIPIH